MPTLETRAFAKTGMQPKSLGLGGAWWGSGTEAECIAGIHRALELGFNYLDTYPELETWWGRALAGGRRHNIYLQAKVTTNGPKETISDHSGPQTRRSVEASLKRLRTDYLDNVLIHGYDEPEDVGSKEGMMDPLAPGHALDELVKMKEEGSIRHIGIGARNSAVHRRAIETGQIEICLTYLEYNLFNTAAAADLFPHARQRQVGLILASPLGMGLLTGDEKVFERSAAYFDNREYPARGLHPAVRARAMWDWCRKRDVNIRHLAIQFCLAAPISSIVLPGAASKTQVEEAYEAATADIAPEIWRDFEEEFGVGI